jgi:hypothetical protein
MSRSYTTQFATVYQIGMFNDKIAVACWRAAMRFPTEPTSILDSANDADQTIAAAKADELTRGRAPDYFVTFAVAAVKSRTN